MDYSYLKILYFCNKFDKVSRTTICEHFNISNDDVRKITVYLKENNYIEYLGESYVCSTYKGKNIIKSIILKWLFEYFIAILALIVSVIALFRTF